MASSLEPPPPPPRGGAPPAGQSGRKAQAARPPDKNSHPQTRGTSAVNAVGQVSTGVRDRGPCLFNWSKRHGPGLKPSAPHKSTVRSRLLPEGPVASVGGGGGAHPPDWAAHPGPAPGRARGGGGGGGGPPSRPLALPSPAQAQACSFLFTGLLPPEAPWPGHAAGPSARSTRRTPCQDPLCGGGGQMSSRWDFPAQKGLGREHSTRGDRRHLR